MATSSSSLANQVASLTAPPTFTGVSKFASGLQQVLTRAEGIASLPLDTLEAGLSTLQNQQSAASTLSSSFSALQQSIASLQTAVSSGLLSAASSDSGVITASAGTGAIAGTYSIEVDNLGSFSTALSNAGSTAVTDPSNAGISSAPNFTLSVGSTTTTITPASASLKDLVTAINTQASGQVQATVVNVGSTGSPDYRLSLQAVKLGTDAIDLQDGSGNDLISSSSPGTLASYIVDGSGNSITSTSRTVTLSTGLTATLNGQNTAGQSSTITVANNSSGIESALNSLATAYNTAVAALAGQQGKSGGALSGDSLINSLGSILGQLGNYSNGSAVGALANYGITLSSSGQISIDSGTFESAANANFSGLLETLGTSTTGGFLQTATNLLNGVEDPSSGLISTEVTQLGNQISNQQTQISSEQARVNTLETNLTAQISKADATIASLESQVSYVTGLFAQYTGATNSQSNGLATL